MQWTTLLFVVKRTTSNKTETFFYWDRNQLNGIKTSASIVRGNRFNTLWKQFKNAPKRTIYIWTIKFEITTHSYTHTISRLSSLSSIEYWQTIKIHRTLHALNKIKYWSYILRLLTNHFHFHTVWVSNFISIWITIPNVTQHDVCYSLCVKKFNK